MDANFSNTSPNKALPSTLSDRVSSNARSVYIFAQSRAGYISAQRLEATIKPKGNAWERLELVPVGEGSSKVAIKNHRGLYLRVDGWPTSWVSQVGEKETFELVSHGKDTLGGDNKYECVSFRAWNGSYIRATKWGCIKLKAPLEESLDRPGLKERWLLLETPEYRGYEDGQKNTAILFGGGFAVGIASGAIGAVTAGVGLIAFIPAVVGVSLSSGLAAGAASSAKKQQQRKAMISAIGNDVATVKQPAVDTKTAYRALVKTALDDVSDRQANV